MRRLFVDANILIAGADSRSGASRAILMLSEIGLLTLVCSRQVLDEAERNIRKKLPAALPVFVELMTRMSLEIVPDPEPTTYTRWLSIIEAKDAPILEAVVQSNVECLLTLNSKDFTERVSAVAGVRVMAPGEFVQELREWVAKGGG